MTHYTGRIAGSPLRKHEKWPKEFPVWENTENYRYLPKHREFCLPSCKFPDSKVQDIALFAVKFSYFSKPALQIKLSRISGIGKGNMFSQTGKHMENMGNLQIGYAWGPWLAMEIFLDCNQSLPNHSGVTWAYSNNLTLFSMLSR